MNLSSVVKGILLLVIILGLMAGVLPSRAPMMRFGEGGPLSWFLMGFNLERVEADHVTGTV